MIISTPSYMMALCVSAATATCCLHHCQVDFGQNSRAQYHAPRADVGILSSPICATASRTLARCLFPISGFLFRLALQKFGPSLL